MRRCAVVVGVLLMMGSAQAEDFSVTRESPSVWGNGKFSEIVTVRGSHTTLYLSGVGATDENQK